MRANAKENVAQEQWEKWENPRPRRKQSSQHCRQPLYRSVVLSDTPSCNTAKCERRERGEGRGEGRGVPHCRYESKWRKQKERRIIAVAYSATSTFGRNYRTSHKTHIRPRGEGERGGGGDRNKTDIWFLMTGMFYFFPLYLKLHAVASSFL